MIRGISSYKSLNLHSLIEPSEKWGPGLQVNRLPQQAAEANTSATSDPSTDVRIVQREDTCILSGDSNMQGTPMDSYI